jgi:RNA polymerase sigma factor (TIGR02999 family)
MRMPNSEPSNPGAPASPLEVTELLRSWNCKDPASRDRILDAVCRELHRLAHHFMLREFPGHTLQTTALLNEAYLRVVDSSSSARWNSRAHFFGAFAQTMRRVLIDWSRASQSEKRGADAPHCSLDKVAPVALASQHLLELDEALNLLSSVDARKARVVEMRFFGGFSQEEIADVLHVSRETVARDWRLARSWLRVRLSGEMSDVA